MEREINELREFYNSPENERMRFSDAEMADMFIKMFSCGNFERKELIKDIANAGSELQDAMQMLFLGLMYD